MEIKNEFTRLCILSALEDRIEKCYELYKKTQKDIYLKEMQVLYVIENQIKGKEETK